MPGGADRTSTRPVFALQLPDRGSGTAVVFLLVFLANMLAGSALALAQESLPKTSNYRGEIRRGTDGRLMVLPEVEPASQESSGNSVSKVLMADVPSLEDERRTYRAWRWSWSASAEPEVTGTVSYTVSNPNLHGDTEGDDLWSYLMMYRRTNQQGYLKRAQAWARYFKEDYRQCKGKSDYTYCADRSNFGLDHLYGWGLVAYYEQFGDAAALAVAEAIAGDVEAIWAGRSNGYGMAFYSLRAGARHLLLVTRVAEVTKKQRWITLRDKLIDLWLNSPDWDVRGMYFPGAEQTDIFYKLGQGAYGAGARVQSPFQIGILTEAFVQAYRTTGRTQLKDRLVAMARFVDRHGLDPHYQYSGSVFGIVNDNTWHNYSSSGPASFWDPVYTTSLVNLLVFGHKFTGDQQLLIRAKQFFNRGTKGLYGDPEKRAAADDVVHHFVDSRFDSSSEDFYLAFNKGELQYTYAIFENGGAPTIENDTSGSVGAARGSGSASGGWTSMNKAAVQPSAGGRGASALAKAAASMRPGTWKRLETTGLTPRLLEVKTTDHGNHILGYADSAVWDPQSKQFMIVGGAHAPNNQGIVNMRHIVYSEATNSWREETKQSWFATSGVSHAYDHHALDPATGTMFYRSGDGDFIHKYVIDSKTWSTTPAINMGYGVAGGLAYFPERGGLVVVNGGHVMFWSALQNNWERLGYRLAMGGYHNFAEYNAVHKTVLFGGGNDSSDLWKLGVTGAPVRLKNAPLSRWIPETTTTVDPVSGDYLVLRRQSSPLFYQYDIVADEWKVLPMYPFADANSPDLSAVAAPIPEYGVVMFLKYGYEPAEVWLYKHRHQ